MSVKSLKCSEYDSNLIVSLHWLVAGYGGCFLLSAVCDLTACWIGGRFKSSELLRRVDWQVATDVSKDRCLLQPLNPETPVNVHLSA